MSDKSDGVEITRFRACFGESSGDAEKTSFRFLAIFVCLESVQQSRRCLSNGTEGFVRNLAQASLKTSDFINERD